LDGFSHKGRAILLLCGGIIYIGIGKYVWWFLEPPEGACIAFVLESCRDVNRSLINVLHISAENIEGEAV
jgi:hypothetical protein